MEWEPNDPKRPRPRAIDPGPPPADAIILFGGTDVSEWETMGGEEIAWRVGYGVLEVRRGSGSIRTRKSFGDCHLHVEWATARYPSESGQERGNSGVLLMGRYEIQILDSYQNETYADGYAGAVYGQHPPFVNPSRPSGDWQIFDVIFRRPRFNNDGAVESPARVTLLFNGVAVLNNVDLTGPTAKGARPPYQRHEDKLPLVLQEHGSALRFRNIWIRDLE